ASQGARVMHPRAVELGLLYRVPILVASSFVDAPGTWIEDRGSMEAANKVRAISHDTRIAKATVRAVPDHPGAAARIFECLGACGLTADAIVQNASVGSEATDL